MMLDRERCAAFATYGDEITGITAMCETVIPGSAWIESFTVEDGVFVYHR
jgi:hypothetical protein